jgi:hypothetical protein
MFKHKKVQFIKCSNLKIFKIVRKKIKEKNKKRKKKQKPRKLEKNRKTTKKIRKNQLRRINRPAQRRAHAGGAEFRPANGRSIGFVLELELSLGLERIFLHSPRSDL